MKISQVLLMLYIAVCINFEIQIAKDEREQAGKYLIAMFIILPFLVCAIMIEGLQ